MVFDYVYNFFAKFNISISTPAKQLNAKFKKERNRNWGDKRLAPGLFKHFQFKFFL